MVFFFLLEKNCDIFKAHQLSSRFYFRVYTKIVLCFSIYLLVLCAPYGFLFVFQTEKQDFKIVLAQSKQY